MNRTDFATFLTGYTRALDFAVRASDEAHSWVLDWFPHVAAHGNLIVAAAEGAVRGLAIAGPVHADRLLAERRPQRLRPDAFDPQGDVLVGMYLFVDPAHRGRRLVFDELMGTARAAFPHTTQWAYWRPGPGLRVRAFRPEPVPVEVPAEEIEV